jgi:hypothetical protein
MKKTLPQIAKNYDVKPYASLDVIVFIGLRDAYYIKLVSGATAAIRDTQSISGYMHASISCWVS